MNFSDITISPNETLLTALKKMDEQNRKLLIVVEGKHFISLISIGDIQRAILKKQSLNESVQSVFRSDILFAKTTDSKNDVIEKMKKERIEFMPIINEQNELVDVLFWENLSIKKTIRFSIPVVIMAGGEGKRLRPLTNIIPKPLIPVSNKTILEEIMQSFLEVGCNEFYFSVNYQADKIRSYFSTLQNKPYSISYIQESKPLGTAGSLSLLKGKITGTFFVSNCDILVDVDLENLLRYHKENKNVITIVSVLKNYAIPYGTIETSENGLLENLNEKPNVLYQINSGFYLLESTIFDYINDDEFLNMTDLILKLKTAGFPIGVFPINERAWTDIGNWSEYLKLVQQYDREK